MEDVMRSGSANVNNLYEMCIVYNNKYILQLFANVPVHICICSGTNDLLNY